MTTSPAPATPRPVTVPTLQDRAGQLAALGWSGREAEWIALVALHTGVFTRSQYGAYLNSGNNRKPAAALVRALLDKQLAIEDERAIFPGARAPSSSPAKPPIARWESPTCGTVGRRTPRRRC